MSFSHLLSYIVLMGGKRDWASTACFSNRFILDLFLPLRSVCADTFVLRILNRSLPPDSQSGRSAEFRWAQMCLPMQTDIPKVWACDMEQMSPPASRCKNSAKF